MPTSKPQASPTRPRSRYGSGKAAREGTTVSGKVIVVFAVALLALVAFAAGRAFLQQQSRTVTAEFITHEVVDDSTARLWVDVHRKHPTEPAYCIVFAVDYDHNEVGRRDVVIPAGGEKSQRLGVEIATRAPITSGRVYGCSEEIPAHLDTASTYLAAR